MRFRRQIVQRGQLSASLWCDGPACLYKSEQSDSIDASQWRWCMMAPANYLSSLRLAALIVSAALSESVGLARR